MGQVAGVAGAVQVQHHFRPLRQAHYGLAQRLGQIGELARGESARHVAVVIGREAGLGGVGQRIADGQHIHPAVQAHSRQPFQ